VWPFSRAPKPSNVDLGDDVFWLRDAPRIDGVITAASRAVASGSHVLLVTHAADRVERLADAAARAGLPLDGLADPITASELTARLRSQPGPCVILSLAATLRPSPPRIGAAPVQASAIILLIADRHPLRARDEAVVSFAESLAAVRAEFHVCIEDPLLRVFSGDQTERILRTLGMKDHESITHRMLSRSVERAQKKLADRCPDHARIESWLAEQVRK
jgi:preprotein translocase subunit SecA